MSPPPVADAQAALALLALSLVALALFELARAGRGSEGASVPAWDRFEREALARGLEASEVASLSLWARRGSADEPSLVLVDRATFDRFVRDEVSGLDRDGGPPQGSPARRDALERLSFLRKKLGHEAPGAGSAGKPLVSSRDILAGTRVTVRPDQLPGAPLATGRLIVARTDEEALELAPDASDPAERAFREAASPGRGAWVVFGRSGEATFRFRARVLSRPGLEPPRLVVSHGDFLLKEERRKTPRIEHRAVVRVLSVDGDAARAFEGETLDLSSGGLSLLSPVPLARGARLVASLPLHGAAAAIEVTIRVVGAGVREGGGERAHFLNAQFVEMAPAARGQLQTFLGAARKTAAARAPAGA
ncbi:PilZ domain-containing protein [bacterium]|nr:PilZ domain-containing protein [bacterium]